MKNFTFLILMAIFFFGGTSVLSAQTTQWTGNVSNDWANPGNWSNGVPNANKTAVIGWFDASKPDPVIFSNTNFKGLNMTNFGRAYEVKIQGDAMVSMETLTMSSGGNPTDVTLDIGNGDLTVTNFLDVLGQISIESGSLSALGGMKVTNYLNAQSGTIVVGANASHADFSMMGGKGIIHLGNTNFIVYGSATFNYDTFDINSGTFTVYEDFSMIGNTDFYLNQASLNILGNASFNNGTDFYAGAGNMDINGNFIISGGAHFYLEQAQLSISGTSTFSSGGQYNGGSGTLEIQGNTDFSGGQDFNAGTSTTILNGDIYIDQVENNQEVTFYNLIVSENSQVDVNMDVIVQNYMYTHGDYQHLNITTLNVIGELTGSENINSPLPYLVDLEVVDSHTLRAVFNQTLREGSAENAANFTIRNGILNNSAILDPISASPVLQGENNNIIIITTNNPIAEFADWVLWVKGAQTLYYQSPTSIVGVRNPAGFAVTNDFHKKRFTKDFVVWTGAVSSDWNNPGNWEYHGIGGYPPINANFDLRYASTVGNPLVLTENVTVNNIDNSTFENMNLGGQKLTITGNVNMNGNGKIIADGEGATVLFKGAAEQLIPNGIFKDNTVTNLSIENTGAGVKLGGNVDVTGVVTMTDGDLNINGKTLTFKCSGEKSAMLAPVISGTINGEVTVERCIPPLRAFRFVSPAVTTTSSIHENWQEGASNYTDNPKPGFGTHITGVGTSPDQTNGFDYTPSGNPSLFLFNNTTQTWGPIANTDVLPLVAGSSYRLMVRGDRSVDITDNETTPTFTILRATGTLSIGNKSVAVNQNAGAYNFVGNPYQAIVNMHAVLQNSNNLNHNFYYVWDPHMGTRGSYVSVDLEMGTTNIPSSEANQFLQPGQAFFVTTAAAGTASVLFEETDKAVEGDFTNVFKPEITAATLNLQLYDAQTYLNGGNVVDGTLLTFSEGESNDVLLNDAAKLGNLDENLCSVNGNNYLAIEKRALPVDGETIPLFINQYRTTTYTLKVESANFAGNVTPYLHDAFLNTDTQLSDGITLIDFEIDPNISSSIAPDRFSITFNVGELSVATNLINKLSVYPNPVAGGDFFVSLPGSAGKTVQVSIYNTLGQKVFASKEKMNGESELKIDIKNLPAGIYIVELDQNAKKFTEKLIIK